MQASRPCVLYRVDRAVYSIRGEPAVICAGLGTSKDDSQYFARRANDCQAFIVVTEILGPGWRRKNVLAIQRERPDVVERDQKAKVTSVFSFRKGNASGHG